MLIGRVVRSGRLQAALVFACIVTVVLVQALFANNRVLQPAGWTLVHERAATGKYEDFAFPNAKHGWLISANGSVIHTADSGKTWKEQATGLGRLRSIDFLDEKRGFAGTIAGQLFGSIDGGATWTDISSKLPRTTLGFCGITHVGEKVHVVGKYSGGAADYFYSPDAGKTWRVTDLKNLAQGLVDVSFIGDSVGFIGGQARTEALAGGPATILKTVNGGRTWRTVFKHDGGRGFAWKIFPVSARIIYASLQSEDGIYRIAKSVDGGDTWTVQTVATGRARGPGIQGIGFIDENTGWVGGFFEGMWATTDGGKTWKAVATSDRTFNRFERVGSTLFTAGTRGILRYTSRGGRG